MIKKIFFFILVLVAINSNCGQKKKVSENILPDTISAYGITITKESSPKEIAYLLIKGLDNDDEKLLAKLVAVKHEIEEIKKLFNKKGMRMKRKPTFEEVATLTAKGWIASYAILEPGRTRIVDEIIEGERASVYCVGINPRGKEQSFEIWFVWEDNRWKAEAGLHWQ